MRSDRLTKIEAHDMSVAEKLFNERRRVRRHVNLQLPLNPHQNAPSSPRLPQHAPPSPGLT